jgi:hypothetical protein
MFWPDAGTWPRPAAALAADPLRSAPFFIVGSPRSGTALVRLMLDGHPRLAVPPESHFVVALAARRHRLSRRPQEAIARICDRHRFRAFGLDPGAVAAMAERAGPATYAEAVRAVFGAYAAACGKARWGDKTPGHVGHIGLLARLFPDAQFIHVVRDGRAVAAWVAGMPFGPADPVAAAFWWRRRVRDGRRAGARLGPARYMELRLEDLIADPERALRAVLAFLGEPWSPAVLDHRGRAEAFLAGSERRRRIHPHVVRPPTAGLRDWRAGLDRRTARLVEAACAPLLAELGYAVDAPSRADRPAARVRRLATLPPEVPAALRLRLRGWRREF